MKKHKKRAPAAEIAPPGGGAEAAEAETPTEPEVAADAPEGADDVNGGGDASGRAEPAFDASEEVTEVSGPLMGEVMADGESVDGESAGGESVDAESADGKSADAESAPGEGEAEALAGSGAAGESGEVADAALGEELAVDSAGRLDSIIESLLFASDRPLGLGDLKRLVNERDVKKLGAAIERLQARHLETGIQLATAGGGWQFRTHPGNAAWVAKLIAGRPARLSRAMLETLAIVAYRQPITRPEIDEIRGVDCGPVLKTLLDRALIRMIGKKEEVGRPILYGTTPEFLRTFSLKDLTELPTLREFHELGVAEMAKVDAQTPAKEGEAAIAAAAAAIPRVMPSATELPEQDPDEEEALLSELDEASNAAARASKPGDPTPSAPPEASPPEISE